MRPSLTSWFCSFLSATLFMSSDKSPATFGSCGPVSSVTCPKCRPSKSRISRNWTVLIFGKLMSLAFSNALRYLSCHSVTDASSELRACLPYCRVTWKQPFGKTGNSGLELLDELELEPDPSSFVLLSDCAILTSSRDWWNTVVKVPELRFKLQYFLDL